MNREMILSSVRRHLCDPISETGEERPLGEIVPLVAREVRMKPAGEHTSPPVVPMEKVAAFVDGHLDPDEDAMVTEAAMVDNSVLAEIIAAVRASQVPTEQLPSLSESLTDRLLAMNSLPFNSPSFSTSPAHAPPVDSSNDESVPDRFPTVERVTAATPAISVAPAEPKRSRTSHARIGFGLAVVAATIMFAMVLLGRARRNDQGTKPNESLIAEQEVSSGSLNTQGEPIGLPPTVDLQVDPQGTPDERYVESIDRSMNTAPATPATSPQDSVAVEPIAQPELAVDPNPDAVAPMPEPGRVVESPIHLQPTSIGVDELRWTEVSGLLTQRVAGSDSSGTRQPPRWRRIREGASAGSITAERVELRTLPFSRAKGVLGQGEFVMAADSGLRVTQGNQNASAELDLLFGSVALVDFSEGTVIQFRRRDRTVATLRWQGEASAIVRRDATGLQIQIDGGEVLVNGSAIQRKTVLVSNDRSMETVAAPKRLPKWVTRPEESGAAERMILAQIADTDDVMVALNQKIKEMATSPTLNRDQSRALAKLASWQAAMAGPALFRLAGSRVPAVRMAALMRLSQMPERDPRFRSTWKAIEASIDNPQRSRQVRLWFHLLRAGTPPNAAQLEQMIQGLSVRDHATRAMSDFMLRQFVRNPPPFDPAWTGPTLQRAVNIYRERAGLVRDRARPSAAGSR